MIKYRDYHFGEDFAEILCKTVCWLLALIVIFVSYWNDESKTLTSSRAMSLMIFAVSYCSDAIIMNRRRGKGWASFWHMVILFAFIYVGVICFFVVAGMNNAPSFFMPSIIWICAIFLILLFVDLFIVGWMASKKNGAENVSERLRVFLEKLGEDQ